MLGLIGYGTRKYPDACSPTNSDSHQSIGFVIDEEIATDDENDDAPPGSSSLYFYVFIMSQHQVSCRECSSSSSRRVRQILDCHVYYQGSAK